MMKMNSKNYNLKRDEFDRSGPRREALPLGRTPAFYGGVEGSYMKLKKSLPGTPAL